MKKLFLLLLAGAAEVTLTLTLTTAQKTRWESTLKSHDYNTSVTVK